MNCIEEIAKDAKVIEIDDQMLVLIKRQVETELMLEEKFRDLCEEVSNFVKEIKDVVKEVERLSCKDVAKGRNFLESFGGPINDLILLLMELPHTLHLKGNFSNHVGVFFLYAEMILALQILLSTEMMKGSSVWSVRYLVNIVQLLNPLPEGWSIRTGVWSICLGEGEEDAFVVINLSGKVVKYNLISKTNTEIFDIGSNQMDDDDADDDAVRFIPPFEVDPNLYEFIPSLASV
ncbi:hypothetical protein Tco_0958586 [Tanacetum coccineum]